MLRPRSNHIRIPQCSRRLTTNRFNKTKKMITRCHLQPYVVVSHGVTMFTLLYCSFNWYYYRTIRKMNEENDEKK